MNGSEQGGNKISILTLLSRSLTVLAAILIIVSCGSNQTASDSPVNYKEVALSESDQKVDQAAVKRQPVSVSPITRDSEPQPSNDYVVGPGDELTINVNGEESMRELRLSVDGNGFIQLPIVNRINVLNLSVAEIQENLVSAFTREFIDPWVVVTVSRYRSRPIYMLGEFQSPGVIHMERPTNITQALGLAGGMTDKAYLEGARLLRDDKIVAVDVEAILNQGRFDQNVWLRSGDTLYVPSVQELKIYVLGAVQEPGVQPYQKEIGVLAAIAAAGGAVKGEAKLKDTRIIRTYSAVSGELMTIDVADLLRGRRPDFQLRPGDIVFIPNRPIANWNLVINQIAPTFQLVSDVLAPFVEIEFLIQNQ